MYNGTKWHKYNKQNSLDENGEYTKHNQYCSACWITLPSPTASATVATMLSVLSDSF